MDGAERRDVMSRDLLTVEMSEDKAEPEQVRSKSFAAWLKWRDRCEQDERGDVVLRSG
jgi:hypothetical protein